MSNPTATVFKALNNWRETEDAIEAHADLFNLTHREALLDFADEYDKTRTRLFDLLQTAPNCLKIIIERQFAI